MTAALLLLATYLIGSVPTSYLVGRITRGIDLREHGSGNLGATNAFRVLGWRAATPIFLVDVTKGFLPVFFFPRIDGTEAIAWTLAYGAAAIVGHMFSIYVGFRGGKGVATGAGVFLALAPLAALGSLVVWMMLVFLTGYVSLASIVSAATLPLLIALAGAPGAVLALSVALAAFVIYAHRANMRRLLRGEEHRFRRGRGTQAKPFPEERTR
ncbi:MAG TPA: glycerol-3-phosphate 1-O-acyltransferase PlsY [Longimicrobiales bacterium]|nr:glycerol-3-phosphate 1-O-acyltransferase PlsY [Longimicrobiales bacterium]